MEVSIRKKTQINTVLVIKWLLTVIIPASFLLIPSSEIFTDRMRLFLIITIFSIMIIAFEFMNVMIPSIFLPLAYLLFNVAPSEVVYSAWSNALPWMFIAVFTIANTFERIGLIERIAYWCVVKIGGGFKGLAISVLAAGLILSLVLPGGNAHAPLLFFVYGICRAMGWGKSKEATVLFMFVSLGTYTTIKFFLNPYIYLIANMQKVAELGPMTFFKYLGHNAIYLLWFVIAAVVIYKMLNPEGKMKSKDYFREHYQSLGKMKTDEKKAILVALLLVALIMTISYHKIEMGWCFVIIACLMYFPFINIATADDVKNANFSMVFFVAACMTIGNVATASGIGNLITSLVVPHLGDLGETGFFFLVLMLGFLGNFVMTPLAIIATLTAPITQIAVDLGINHLPVWYTLSISTNLFVLPYEYVAYLFMFSFGLMELKDFVKVYSVKSCLLVLFTLFVALPYWRLIGLL